MSVFQTQLGPPLVLDEEQPSVNDSVQHSIFDIRCDRDGAGLRSELETNLFTGKYPITKMPELLLWDEEGLRRFEDVTYCPSYYLTNAEIAVLEQNSQEISKNIKSDNMLIELGSGNLRKTNILLQALEDLGHRVDYFALDVSLPELERTLQHLPVPHFQNVRCFGLLGTYDDCREWIQRAPVCYREKTLMSLGSSLGSFKRNECSSLLSSFISDTPNEFKPSFLIALDGCKDAAKVWNAYNDTEGFNEIFIKHGLERANEILGRRIFDLDKWGVRGSWDHENGCHDQLYFPRENLELAGWPFSTTMSILAIQSFKYSEEERETLFREAGLEARGIWSSPENYNVCFVSPVHK